jgi:hypothetical protein
MSASLLTRVGCSGAALRVVATAWMHPMETTSERKRQESNQLPLGITESDSESPRAEVEDSKEDRPRPRPWTRPARPTPTATSLILSRGDGAVALMRKLCCVPISIVTSCAGRARGRGGQLHSPWLCHARPYRARHARSDPSTLGAARRPTGLSASS